MKDASDELRPDLNINFLVDIRRAVSRPTIFFTDFLESESGTILFYTFRKIFLKTIITTWAI